VKRYVVELTGTERTQLLDLTSKGKVSARKLNRAHILLLADEGRTDLEIAAALHVSKSTVERVRTRFVTGNLDFALTEQMRPGARRKLDGKQEAFLVATACSSAPEGRSRWTLQLLADRLVELKVVDSISRDTVRRTLKKTISSRG
jgi:transposase